MKVKQVLQFYREQRTDVVAQARLETAIFRLNDILGEKNVTKVDVNTCRLYADIRSEQTTYRHGKVHKIAESTVARELGVLRAAVNCCIKHRKIKMVSLDQMPTFDIPSNLPKREVWFLDDELRQLYDNAAGIMYNYIRLLYITGSRRKAIETLEWSQVDFKRGVINLDKPNAKKTKKRRPTVPIGKLNKELTELYNRRTNNYVLGSSTDRYRAFVILLEKCGLTELKETDGRPAGRASPHILRHSRATHLLEAGMSIYAVAKLLGDNPTTVERVYGHACTSKLTEELEKYS